MFIKEYGEIILQHAFLILFVFCFTLCSVNFPIMTIALTLSSFIGTAVITYIVVKTMEETDASEDEEKK